MVDEADHQCGQNGPDRESPEQSATKNIPHFCHIITRAYFVDKTDRTENLRSRAQLRTGYIPRIRFLLRFYQNIEKSESHVTPF